MSRSWRPPITLLVALIVVLPIVVVSGILAALSFATSARVAQKLADEVMTGAARSVGAEIQNYLSDAVRVSDRYVRRLESAELPDPPGQAWERPMLDDLTTIPSVASICYGNARGDATWLLRGMGRLEVGRADGAASGSAVEYPIDPQTARPFGDPIRVYTYDPRVRPWWSVAAASDGPRWTPVYSWYAGNSAETMIGTGYTRAIRDAEGKLRGVLVVDVTLGALSNFLRKMEIAKDGRLFIQDGEGRLVASSHGRVTDDAGERFDLLSAPEPAARSVGAAIERARAAQAGAHGLSVTIEGAPARARITQVHPFPGIDWRVIAVVPESAFLAEAQAVRRRAVTVGLAAIAGSLVLGVVLARYLSRPIVRMTEHVKKVGSGDFDRRLDLHGAKELAVLSDEINRMAGGLKQRMALEHSLAVAMEVQQSLLPAGDPRSGRLDVAGRSHYCDQTGGDYFDFIDIAPISETSLLVAVGDVMGHGIAAALLMASARAALRTNALAGPGLAALMTKTNRVLASSNRHNRFMTLALMRIDGEQGVVNWASAGHDPAILYDPGAGAFRDLEGGDVPLGVVEDVEYQEYSSGPVPSGCVLVIGTDGVWEMLNEGDQQYGKERLKELVRTNHARPASEIATALEADLATFRGRREPQDDVTFVIVKFVGAKVGAGASVAS